MRSLLAAQIRGPIDEKVGQTFQFFHIFAEFSRVDTNKIKEGIKLIIKILAENNREILTR